MAFRPASFAVRSIEAWIPGSAARPRDDENFGDSQAFRPAKSAARTVETWVSDRLIEVRDAESLRDKSDSYRLQPLRRIVAARGRYG